MTLISHLVSVGDATIKFWSISSDQLQLIQEHTMEQINGFDTNYTDMIAYGDNKSVQLQSLTMEDGLLKLGDPELAMQFNTQVRKVQFVGGKYLAAISEDSTAHLMFLDSKTVKKLPKGGHEANIKNFAVDPLCEFIATIGCDGTLIVS